MSINFDKAGTAFTNIILMDAQMEGWKTFCPISLNTDFSLKLFKHFAFNPKAHEAITSVENW